MPLARCILDKFLEIGCHCFPPPLDVPTFSTRCLHVQRREISAAAEGETLCGREMFRQISPRIRLPRNSRNLLQICDMEQTALLPLRRSAEDFSALKNPTASAGFKPANMGTKGQHATFRQPKSLLSP
jgi:hypothetical protein